MEQVTRIRGRLAELLDKDWQSDNGDATIAIKYLPFNRQIADAKDIEMHSQLLGR